MTDPGASAPSILVVGESLVDIVAGPDGAVREHVGGSPANVALGLARLGRPVHLLTRFGDDARGQAVRDHLTSAGVSLVGRGVDQAETSTATATLDARGGATYEFRLTWQLPEVALPPQPVAVHTGSLAAFLEPGAATVERVLRGAHRTSTISYDPNLRPALMGDPAAARSRVESIVASSDLVKVSDEDLAWLAPHADPTDVARRWLSLGPALVVLTRGSQGATALARAGRLDCPAPAVRVVDTVGAGDAFMAGLLDALAAQDLLGADRRSALRELGAGALGAVVGHAVRISALVCTRAGAQPPTRAELDAWHPSP